MQLGTFGAIMGFAMDMEEQAAAFYEQAAHAKLAEPFGQLAQGSHKRAKRLERARRELVSEMILESITGLDGDHYQLDLDPQADDGALLRQALEMEEEALTFYGDAAAKMPIREVVRLFGRLARENERRLGQVAECKNACGL